MFFNNLDAKGFNSGRSFEEIATFFHKTQFTMYSEADLMWGFPKDMNYVELTPAEFSANQTLGGDHLFGFLGLGFQKDPNLALRLPKDISTLFFRIYQSLIQSSRSHGLSDNDILWPSLIFYQGDTKDTFQTRAIRPGIDTDLAFLDEGQWQLVDFEVPNFGALIAEGRMPISVGTMLLHELGHVIDLIRSPGYMPSFKNYMKLKERVEKTFPGKPIEMAKKYGPLVYRGSPDKLTNEFLNLANPRAESVVRKIFPDILKGEPRSLLQIQQSYEKLQVDELAERLNHLIQEKARVILMHGGGTHDSIILKERSLQRILKVIHELIEGESEPYNLKHVDGKYAGSGHPWDAIPDFNEVRYQQSSYYRHSLFGWLYLGSDLLKLLKGQPLHEQYHTMARESFTSISSITKPENTFFVEALAQPNLVHGELASPDLRKKFEPILRQILARVEQQLEWSLALKITPEKITNELQLLYQEDGWKEFKKSDSYRFFSTHMIGSATWFHIADIAREFDATPR